MSDRSASPRLRGGISYAVGMLSLALALAFAALLSLRSADAKGRGLVNLGLLPVTVDVSSSDGELKRLCGVNGPPVPDGMPFIRKRLGEFDDTEAYRAARVCLVRTHDAGAADIDAVYSRRMMAIGAPPPQVLRPAVALNSHSIFLNPNADPDDPASYNFGPSDRLVRQIRAAGAQPLYRLGRSITADADPPGNFQKWARIAAHVVMHYNEGWDHGFHYGIKYWEVWNEPDMSTFWQGTPEEYYRLYAAVSKAVKAADPTVLVGGPTQSLPLSAHPYGVDFLAYVRNHHLPLDFYSWHWYPVANDPYDFYRLATIIRARLDAYGFKNTLSIIDEWNSTVKAGSDDYVPNNTGQHAAYVGTALAYMEKAPVDQELIYRVDGYFARRTLEADVLTAWSWMHSTPIRLRTTGTRTDGFAVVAGKSRDGKLVQVFISDYSAPLPDRAPSPAVRGTLYQHVPFEGNFAIFRRQLDYDTNDGYHLTVTGLSGGQHIVARYRISKCHALSLVRSETVTGSTIRLTSHLSPSGVEILKIQNQP